VFNLTVFSNYVCRVSKVQELKVILDYFSIGTDREMGGACSTYGGEQWCVQDLGGETEGKRPLGRPRHRWKDNIKMDRQEVGWGMDWIDLAKDRDRWLALVDEVMNCQVP
jgi:hypothetical protein